MYPITHAVVPIDHNLVLSLCINFAVRIDPNAVDDKDQCLSAGQSNVPSATASKAYPNSSTNVISVSSSSLAIAYPAIAPVANATTTGSADHFAMSNRLPAFCVNAGSSVLHFNAAYAAEPARSKDAML